mgnify:CR=1 FL=1
MKQYVIIGNGVAAIGAIEGIRKVDKDGKITEETALTYATNPEMLKRRLR